MMLHEKRIKSILKQKMEISDTVSRRIGETYRMVRENSDAVKKPVQSRKVSYVAAVLAAVLCVGIPGGVYAAVEGDFFENMFGNGTKEWIDASIETIPDGKGKNVQVTLPAHEYVTVDKSRAEELIGRYVMDAPVVKKIGEHTLCVEGIAYDKNGMLMSFTIEREGGVTALAGNNETNRTKGAYFAESSDFYFHVESKAGITGYENIYVDTQKSTDEKWYCYNYILWEESLSDADIPQLVIDNYPVARKDLKEDSDIKTEILELGVKGQIPVQNIDMGDLGYLEYSPISLGVDMAKGMGLSKTEAEDPYYLERIEIKYKDGSSYIVSDKENNIESSGYVCGTGTWYKVAFDRLVDTDEIKEIIVNGVTFCK